jgi:hypothetical protein
MQNNFSEDYQQFGPARKNVRQTPLRPKRFKEYHNERQIVSLPGAPTCLRLALIGVLIVVVAEVQPSIL